MSVPILNSPLRTLLAGSVMAAAAVVLAVVGEAIGVSQPWPVLLVAGAGLLVGIPRLQHGLALGVGATFGLITTWLVAEILPDVTTGTALATGVAMLLITVVTVATSGQLRFGMQLVGWAAMTALSGAPIGPGSVTSIPAGQLLRDYLAVLIASGLGLLVAQVAQLLATGVSSRRAGSAGGATGVVPAIVVSLALAGLATAAGTARADEVRAPTVHHQQTIVRTHTVAGTPARGAVITRLSSVGAGDASVVLRDQSVTDLRSRSRYGESEVSGTSVTHVLAEGAAVRTVAALERALPVTIEVAYRLDGAPISPAALAGRSGRLEATYTLTNRTAEPRELRFFDAKGRARTVTRDVSVPFAGTLSVRIDGRFSAARAAPGRIVADLAGDQHLTADVVLFGPVGAAVQTFTWSADVRDAVVPAVQVRLAPVGPFIAPAGDVAAGAPNVEVGSDVLRDVTDAAGLLRTGLSALGAGFATTAADAPSAAVLGQMDRALTELLETTVAASARTNEDRALLVAQDQRRLAGDGLVHGLLAAGPDVPAGVRVDARVVYVLEVAGTPGDGGPPVPLRFGLVVVLLVAVGLLGRAVGVLTGDTSASRDAGHETGQER